MGQKPVSGDSGLVINEEPPSYRSAGGGRGSSSTAVRNTARVAGVWYLALALAGVFGFLLIRPQIYVAGDPTATLANLVDHEGVARLGLVFELALVVTQALAAVWFYKLFRSINQTAAFAVAVFGMANAIAVMASAVFMATALTVAGDASLAPGGDVAAATQLMYQLSSTCWGVGSLFFGLWLIPMGHIAASSGRMPKWLGRVLIIGGCGYLVSGFVSYGLAGAPSWLVDGLAIPATIGELWMIGYLLTKGLRDSAEETQTPSVEVSAAGVSQTSDWRAP